MSKSFSVFSSPFSFVATLFGIGLLPIAPGTWGSLVALCSYVFFVIFFAWNLQIVILVTGLIIFFSIWICEKATTSLPLSEKDQRSIVLYEFAGLWVACLPATGILMVKEILLFSLFAFVFFRIFDILKPIPINLIDKKFKNGFGIVADDLIAGVYSSIITSLIFYLFF